MYNSTKSGDPEKKFSRESLLEHATVCHKTVVIQY